MDSIPWKVTAWFEQHYGPSGERYMESRQYLSNSETPPGKRSFWKEYPLNLDLPAVSRVSLTLTPSEARCFPRYQSAFFQYFPPASHFSTLGNLVSSSWTAASERT